MIQGPLHAKLSTEQMAVDFNAALPCSGEIVRLQRTGDVVTATFVLGDRPASHCNAPPGARAAAAFTIRDGKIVLWEQVPTTQDGTSI